MKLPDLIRGSLSHLCEDIPPNANEYDSDVGKGHWWYLRPECTEDVKLFLRITNMNVGVHNPDVGDEEYFDMARSQINIVEVCKRYSKAIKQPEEKDDEWL